MSTSFIGRHHELGVLIDTIKGASRGRFAAVLIRGEPGIGKTRLLSEAMAQAELLGHLVLYGRVDELDRDVPFVALRAALDPVLRAERDPQLLESVDDLRQGLWLGADATSRPLRGVFASAERLLRAWGRRQPVLIAIDDLHAADRDTLAVLSLLIRHLEGARVTLVGTARPDPPYLPVEVGTVLDRLVADDLLAAIDLGEFDSQEVRALAASVLGGALDDELATRLWQSTSGNPFFVTEAIRFLQSAGGIQTLEDGTCVADPDVVLRLTVRAALLHRVFQLGADARATARALSVLTRVRLDDLDLLAGVCGLATDRVDAAFDLLVAARLVARHADTYAFAHPIVRDTLYEDLGPAERRRAHAAVATTLLGGRTQGRSVGDVELAVHVAASASAGDAEAAVILGNAGHASVRSAPASAVVWFERAAELAGSGDRRDEYLAAQVRALFLSSRFEQASQIANKVLPRLPAGEAKAKTVALHMSCLAALGQFQEALDEVDALLGPGLLGPGPGGLSRLRAERARMLLYLSRFEECETQCQDVLATAAHDPLAISLAYGHLAAKAYQVGDIDACLAHLDRQSVLSENLSAFSRLSNLANRASYLAFLGSLGAAESTLVEGRALCDEVGGAAFRSVLDTAATLTDWLAGRWDDVLERNLWVDLHAEFSTHHSRTLTRMAAVAVCCDRGLYGKARQAAKDLPVGEEVSAAAWATARLHGALGELDTAEAILRSSYQRDVADGRRANVALTLSSLVDTELERGDPAAAGRWAKELADQVSPSSPWPFVLSGRSLAAATGDLDAGRAALAVADHEGLVVEAARLRLILGSRGDEPEQHLPAALEVFRKVGAEGDRTRTTAAMCAAGIELRRARRGKATELTAGEVRLAQLVAEGLTNRQIANAVHYSPKTVEVYLSRVYAKTGCTSRVELALAVKEGKVQPPDA